MKDPSLWIYSQGVFQLQNNHREPSTMPHIYIATRPICLWGSSSEVLRTVFYPLGSLNPGNQPPVLATDKTWQHWSKKSLCIRTNNRILILFLRNNLPWIVWRRLECFRSFRWGTPSLLAAFSCDLWLWLWPVETERRDNVWRQTHSTINPSNAEATFIQSTKMQIFLKPI